MAGIYIHIPFCHSKCSYCDFYSIPMPGLKSDYIKALVKELEIWLQKKEVQGIVWDTVYIGGGTPSILALEELLTIVKALPLKNVKEFTIEANPEDVNDEWASAVKSFGINRVSIGIQSFSDEELKLVGRNHTSKQAVQALHVLRKNGIENISADLIYGLPGQTFESWKSSLDSLLAFKPEHISSYALSYEPGTRLYAQRNTGKISETDDDTINCMYDYLINITSEHGFDHYEISNFGLPARHSRHNSSYWTFTPYLGVGAAAHGFIGNTRYANPWNIKKYIDTIMTGELIAEKEDLTPDDIYNEYLMVSLRTSEGLLFPRVIELTDHEHYEFLKKGIQKINHEGLIIPTLSGIRIPENNWMVSDAIIRDLMI